MKTAQVEASYLRPMFELDNFKATVDRAVTALRLFDAQTPFDSIAFCGMSGSSLAFPLSYILNKHLLCVRKSERIDSHSYRKFEGVSNSESYIVVDDCVDSGETVERIRKTVEDSDNYRRTKPECVGIYLFLPARQTTDRIKNPALKKQVEQGVRIISVPFDDGEYF